MVDFKTVPRAGRVCLFVCVSVDSHGPLITLCVCLCRKVVREPQVAALSRCLHPSVPSVQSPAH